MFKFMGKKIIKIFTQIKCPYLDIYRGFFRCLHGKHSLMSCLAYWSCTCACTFKVPVYVAARDTTKNDNIFTEFNFKKPQ